MAFRTVCIEVILITKLAHCNFYQFLREGSYLCMYFTATSSQACVSIISLKHCMLPLFQRFFSSVVLFMQSLDFTSLAEKEIPYFLVCSLH